MISRLFRFHGHNSLSFAHRQGKVVRKAGIALRYVENPRRSRYRAAVVVSKKVSKSAVVRNRIRRRIYAAVQGSVPRDAVFDLVFMVYDDRFAGIAEKELNKTIFELLQTAGIGEGNGRGYSPAAAGAGETGEGSASSV
jgi:ribonuclease P protein component